MKVTVLIVTYNREKYIAQALDSVLMQAVDFDYEILIGEDCSTDATRDIVIGYQKRHPNRIRLLLHEQNLGYIPNELECFRNCRGEYIATLDSDDYWTSRDKLQRQVEYLDQHPDCSACFHKVTVFSDDSSFESYSAPHTSLQRTLCLDDLVESIPIYTGSPMFRRRALDESLLSALSLAVIGDWELYLFLAERGSIGYIDQDMAAYRKNDCGIYTGLGPIRQLAQRIEMFEYLHVYMDDKYGKKYRKTYTEHISRCNHALAVEYIHANDLAAGRSYFWKSILKCPFNKRKSLAEVAKTFIRLFFPPLFNLLRLHVNQDPSLF